MAITQGFEHFADAVDIDRIKADVNKRSDELNSAQNREIISLGQIAVNEGTFTPDTLVGITKATITRHLALMSRIGITLVRPEYSDRDQFDIGSKLVNLTPDIAVSLRQRSHTLSSAEGFWNYFEETGLETALRNYASPRTTVVNAYDMKRNGKPVSTVTLGPDSFSDTDQEFREQWDRSFFPFPRALDSAIERQREGGLHTPRAGETLSSKKVIVAAGLNAVFNGLLDEVEAYIR